MAILGLALGAMVAGGCAYGDAALSSKMDVDLLSSVGPDSMRARVLHEMEKIEGYPVAKDDGEVVQTAWKEIPGKTTGFWLWKRQWLARVRYSVELVPRADGTRLASGVRIKGEYEERPNANFPWKAGADEQRDEEINRFKPILISRLRDSHQGQTP